MRAIARILAVVLALAATACASNFDNPPAGPTVAPDPYLGEWLPAQGSSSNDSVFVEEGTSGEAMVTVDLETDETITGTVQLTDVGGDTIASVPGNEGWQHFKVEALTDTLRVWQMDEAKLRTDVETGILAGEVVTQTGEPGEDLVRVTASETELAEYLIDHPDVFPVSPNGELQRSEAAALLTEPEPSPFRQRRTVALTALGVLALVVLASALQARRES